MCCPAERFAAGSRMFAAIQPSGPVLAEVRFSDAQGVTLYIGKRTFLTAMAEIASGKKVRFLAVETMKNLEKIARKKAAVHHQLMSAPTEIKPRDAARAFRSHL